MINEQERQDREAIKLASEMMMRIIVVRDAIVDDIAAHDATGSDCAGVIDCPACAEGRVAYTYAGTANGHVSARCSTQGCVQWME